MCHTCLYMRDFWQSWGGDHVQYMKWRDRKWTSSMFIGPAIKSIQILRNLIFAVFLTGEMLVAVILTGFATVQCAFSSIDFTRIYTPALETQNIAPIPLPCFETGPSFLIASCHCHLNRSRWQFHSPDPEQES